MKYLKYYIPSFTVILFILIILKGEYYPTAFLIGFSLFIIIGDLEICAGIVDEGGKDACQGDSGGPLICVNKAGEPVLHGVVSWGIGCARPDFAGVYAEVQAVMDWVNDVAGDGTGSTVKPPNSTKPPGTGQTNQYGWRNCEGNVIHGVNKIVGGEEADPNSWPWIVGLVNRGGSRPWCGGSIISDNYVLTAAHCCDGSSASNIEIRVGMHNWSDGQNIRVKTIKKHNKYGTNPNSDIANDFCLLETEPIPLDGDKVDIVCLPKAGAVVKPKTMCFTAGWGTTSSGGSQSQDLMMAKGPIVSDQKCANMYSQAGMNIIKGVEICFGYDEGGVDACQGDSGGPLICIDEDTQEPVLHGVVSWGIGCADKDFPGVNAEVQSAISWMKQNT
jgi:secreted trypsin-like serine protease